MTKIHMGVETVNNTITRNTSEVTMAQDNEHDKVEELVDRGIITEEEAEDLHEEISTSNVLQNDDEQETK